ncbi:MAG: hypothetical protein WAV31_00915 [Candidatus Moraniibacteriota bacterium]
MDLVQIFSQLGFTQKATLDVTLLIVVVFISLILGMLIGRYKLIAILINTYIAIAILSVVSIKILPDYLYRLGLFFGIIIILTALSKRMFEIPISGAGRSYFWRVFVMSFLETTLVLSTILSIIPKKVALSYVSLNSYTYLTSQYASLFWIVIPLLFTFLIINKKFTR